MRILSFQGKTVWDDVLKNGRTYHADWNLARERVSLDDITKDILQLSGECPVWGYTQPYFNYSNIWDGSMIEKIRCEMSLNQEDAFADMYLFELEIPLEEVFSGQHHNDNKFVVTFGRIEPGWVRAVYTVEDCKKGSHMEQWYYKVITNIYANVAATGGKLDVITMGKIDMYILSLEDPWDSEHHPPHITSVGKQEKCLGCKRMTDIWYKGKPFCSFSCLTKTKLNFGIAGIEFRVNGEDVFEKVNNEDLKTNSIRELVCLHAEDADVSKLDLKGWLCKDGKHYEWRK